MFDADQVYHVVDVVNEVGNCRWLGIADVNVESRGMRHAAVVTDSQQQFIAEVAAVIG